MKIGILWDIENVRPPSEHNYVQAIIEAVCADGFLSYAMAFGDWSNTSMRGIADEMAASNFELIHTPHGKKKNSADMSLVAHGVELIFQYPNIERFVLISGDGDFRPLLLTQKKHGKETWVVCDMNRSASQDLFKMADHALDYRDIIKESEAFDETEDFDETDGAEAERADTDLSRERAFELFKETVGLMLSAGNTPASGGVKSRMKLLNQQFDEKALGYDSWRAFVRDATRATQIVHKGGAFEFTKKPDSTIPSVFKALIDALPADGEPILFATVARQIDFKGSGYKKFKDLALDAEKRGYVTTEGAGMNWSLKRSKGV
jgi:hypothetical protein